MGKINKERVHELKNRKWPFLKNSELLAGRRKKRSRKLGYLNTIPKAVNLSPEDAEPADTMSTGCMPKHSL